MDLYDILACPTCKIAVERLESELVCPQCTQHYPIVNGVPVLFPDGSIPEIQHERELHIRPGYDPWIPRVMLQSLLPSSIVLDVGAGNMALNLPNVIRTDVTLTPYVDVVADAHALPFLPGTIDFVFSLAVIEHLRNPFVAAQETYNVLRDGGYVYGECNFVFPYHGYPHHYFNATQQGLEETFKIFRKLRSGVAPYQLPSFALRAYLGTYIRDFQWPNDPAVSAYRTLLEDFLNQPLGTYDQYFTEEGALNTAAGTFFYGVKEGAGNSKVIPEELQTAWQTSEELRRDLPDIANLGTAENILLWAKREGQATHTDIPHVLTAQEPFQKYAADYTDALAMFEALPVIEPTFVNVPDLNHRPDYSDMFVNYLSAKVAGVDTGAVGKRITAFEEQIATLEQRNAALETQVNLKNNHIAYLESLIKRVEAGALMRILRRFKS